MGYSGINTARSALSAITALENNVPIGKHPLVQRLVKGVFNCRPSLPRYHNTWDTNVVLNYLKTLPNVNEINLRQLTYKLVMLCALITGQRCQSIHLMNLNNMEKKHSSYCFSIDSLVKQSAPGRSQPVLVIPKFAADESLCAVTVLEEYIKRTEGIRCHEPQLFISTIKPFKRVSKDTIGRWIKTVMTLSGIDTSIYKPHSTRAAATSKANVCNVPITSIMAAASWSSDSTFHKFYNKHVNVTNDNYDQFGQAILWDATT